MTRPSAEDAPVLLLWDVDGTLVDSEPLHARVLARTLEAEGLVPPPDLHAQVLGKSPRAIHAMFQQQQGLRCDFDGWSARRWSIYLAQAPALRARPGADEAVRAAAARGWTQAAVSNSNLVAVEANLAAAGLRALLATVVGAEDFQRPKPDPEPYQVALRRLGVDAARAIAIEDSGPGARAAAAAGCRTLYWPQSPAAPVPGTTAVAPEAEALWPAVLAAVRSLG